MRSPIVYFLTGGAAVPPYALGRIGRKEPASGPDGRTGALVATCPGSAEYFPEFQRWVRHSGTPEMGVMLGIDTSQRPKPADLVRETVHPGHLVTLGDKQEWEIPVARLAGGGSGLPRRRVVKDDGTRAWEVEGAFRGLSDFADKVYALYNGEAVTIPDDEADRMCGEALSVNYRIHELEMLAMGLLTNTALRQILRALLDVPTIERIADSEKKAESPIAAG
jgi:hypothetical protein